MPRGSRRASSGTAARRSSTRRARSSGSSTRFRGRSSGGRSPKRSGPRRRATGSARPARRSRCSVPRPAHRSTRWRGWSPDSISRSRSAARTGSIRMHRVGSPSGSAPADANTRRRGDRDDGRGRRAAAADRAIAVPARVADAAAVERTCAPADRALERRAGSCIRARGGTARRLARRRSARARSRRAARCARERDAAAARRGLRLLHRPRRGAVADAAALRRPGGDRRGARRGRVERARRREPSGRLRRAAHRARYARVRGPRAAAGALGSHHVRVGWFPRLRAGAARVYRIDGAGQRTLAAIVHEPASSWDDGAVQPGATMQYAVVRTTETQVVRAAVPAELPASASDALRGKSAWLAFSADPLDDASYLKLDVDRIVATAARAGLRSVELRLAYGAFDETGPAAKPVIDRLIDGFAARRIAVIGWTVPRTPAFEDLARNAEVAAYRTPAGNGITGLAVDLERGEEFLGSGSRGYAALRSYLSVLRRAVGPHVLRVATVEDPFLEHLDQTSFPYREIARDADVLQPMTYWRMLGPWDTIPKVQGAAGESVALVRALAGREIAIDVGAQTGVLSKRGAPTS